MQTGEISGIVRVTAKHIFRSMYGVYICRIHTYGMYMYMYMYMSCIGIWHTYVYGIYGVYMFVAYIELPPAIYFHNIWRMYDLYSI
jgi:hypothetical protein